MKKRLQEENRGRSAGRWGFLLLASLGLLAAPTAHRAGADPVKAAPAQPALEAVPDTYDFGRRALEDTSPITHRFVLTSHAKSAITVDRLQPSCRCTSAVADRAADQDGRFVIPPGQTADVDVTVNPSDMTSGDMEKEVFVFVEGESVPRLTLEIKGTILPPGSPPAAEQNTKNAKTN